MVNMVLCFIGCSPCWICVGRVDLLPLPAPSSAARSHQTPGGPQPRVLLPAQLRTQRRRRNSRCSGPFGMPTARTCRSANPAKLGLVSGHSSVVTSPSGKLRPHVKTCFSLPRRLRSSQSSQRLSKRSAARKCPLGRRNVAQRASPPIGPNVVGLPGRVSEADAWDLATSTWTRWVISDLARLVVPNPLD